MERPYFVLDGIKCYFIVDTLIKFRFGLRTAIADCRVKALVNRRLILGVSNTRVGRGSMKVSTARTNCTAFVNV